MNGEICWLVELTIKPGQLETFGALTGEMVDSTRRELGVLSYQRFISEDRKTIHVFERYEDSAAALAHLQVFAEKFAARFQELVERKRFVVFGCPTAELKAALDGYGASYATLFGEFAYWA
ncbi:MAG TPA: antibiotic biosynthesis monooxygenase [Steroidobacteraceae bacterium]|nr:antibiotic biosynthesis monooxygenase [Steroidobacteraceae bacterium]